jgi:hypothetical protein
MAGQQAVEKAVQRTAVAVQPAGEAAQQAFELYREREKPNGKQKRTSSWLYKFCIESRGGWTLTVSRKG